MKATRATPLPQSQCRFEGFRQALAELGPDFEAIDDGFDGVLAAHVEFAGLVEFHDLSVDSRAHEAARLQFFDDLRMFTLAFGDHGREQHQRSSLRLLKHGVDHLAHGLGREVDVVVGAARVPARAYNRRR